jgi:iron complex outermembrane receptor protein
MASAHAQPTTADNPADAADTLPTVRITGTSLRRIDAETALPVTVLRRADIERSGAKTTTELLQQLPVMQGVMQTTAVVGQDSKGYASLSIHDLGDQYTLVLLNGQRIAPFGGQLANGALSAVDINTIPLAIVERIEVLTDGASAVYGADALGGVVNIITRRDGDANEGSVGVTVPKGGGAREWRASALKSIGSLDETGQNLSLAVSAMHRTALRAADRGYARDAIRDFSHQGQRYRFADVQDAVAPAMIYDFSGFGFANPMLQSTGACPKGTYIYNNPYDPVFSFPLCSYNYAGDLDLMPDQKQQSLMTSFSKQWAPDSKLQLDMLLSRSIVTSHLSPAATGFYGLNLGASSPTYANYLSGLGVTDDPVNLSYRFVDLGRRGFEDTSDLVHLAGRLDGRLSAWTWSAGMQYSLSHQRSDVDNALSTGAAQYLFDAGLINPVVTAGHQSAGDLAAQRAASYSGHWLSGRSTLAELQWQASRDLVDLPGGPLKWAVGANVRQERLSFNPSLFAQGLLATSADGQVPSSYDINNLPLSAQAAMQASTASRYVWGAFTELLAPVTPAWDLGAALRTDHDAIAGGAVTGKLSARWKVSPGVLWRSSLGTGFRAPALNQLMVPAQSFGTTPAAYECTPDLQALQARLGADACSATAQYPQVGTGNSQLKPERSVQGSMGIKLEPIAGHTLGFDVWAVQIRDRIGVVSSDTAFANPVAFAGSFTTVQTAGGTSLAYVARPMNFESMLSSGLDFDAGVRRGSPIGVIDSQFRVSTILREDAQAYPGGPWQSSIGTGEHGGATLKWKANWRTSLIASGWTHSLTMRYQSGYVANAIDAYPLDDSGQPMGEAQKVRLKVSGQVLWDWQSSWQINGAWQVTAGVVNLFDTKPPLTLNGLDGANKGQQLGYDERYFDARGRMVTVEARLSF